MSPLRSRSNSPADMDDAKREQRSSSVPDEMKSEIKRTVVSRFRSRSNSRSRSRSRRRSGSRDRRDRSRTRSRSRRRSRSRSRSRSRGRRSYRSRSRSRGRRSRSRSFGEEFRLHVGDINEDCRKRDLEKIFSKYGPLKEIWLATYAPYYAFINYESKSDMEYAVKRADGEKVAGRRMRVTVAKPRNRGPRNSYRR